MRPHMQEIFARLRTKADPPMTSPNVKTCIVCTRVIRRRPDENPKAWEEHTTCSRKCGGSLSTTQGIARHA